MGIAIHLPVGILHHLDTITQTMFLILITDMNDTHPHHLMSFMTIVGLGNMGIHLEKDMGMLEMAVTVQGIDIKLMPHHIIEMIIEEEVMAFEGVAVAMV